ncbi:MAG: phosphatidylserine decarboxylase [Nitrospirales bacterium]|nr:phosphatidylserine decarboxylase [Nitrospira sp.]MDR4500025.1 phosphatidylserine decarboxylase [Nitrospirales bacterium]
MSPIAHQYIDRQTAHVITERFFGDRMVNTLYSSARERAPELFHALTSFRTSQLLSYWTYDSRVMAKFSGMSRFTRSLGIDLSECLDPPSTLNTPRKVFERKIRYWDVRPMDDAQSTVVSPADARVLFGSFASSSMLFLKGKFFDFVDLLGQDKPLWRHAFQDGDYAIFRLTPDKYHYNHAPVSGTVIDSYEIPGCYHSCNPGPVISLATPFSKNKRTVTIIDTDVPDGSQVGLVAMIEIVALMIGTIVQCYSEHRYDDPQDMSKGLFMKKGQPKSLYRPGSSTDVLIFQKHRITPCKDLIENMHRQDVRSRYSLGFGQPLVETDITARSTIATAYESKAYGQASR